MGFVGFLEVVGFVQIVGFDGCDEFVGLVLLEVYVWFVTQPNNIIGCNGFNGFA